MRRALLLLLLAVPACASPAPSEAEASSDVTASSLSASDVESVIADLDARRTEDPIGRYYENGDRLEGCWRNPAGAKLTDLKKALYCSMPLEFRLCNTVVLLTIDESQPDDRYAGYLACQKTVDAVFDHSGRFVFDAKTNAVYQKLYLHGETLSKEDTQRIVDAHHPTESDRSFTVVLAAIAAGLAREAVELGVDALTSMVDDYETAAKATPSR